MIKKFSGFTLAEVLIAMGLVGVISAITVPNLITNLSERQYLAEYKTVYSHLENALQNMSFSGKIFACYQCSNQSGYGFSLKGGCYNKTTACSMFYKKFLEKLGSDDNSGRIPPSYTYTNAPTCMSGNGSNKYLLPNGMYFIRSSAEPYTFAIDLNGNRGPNKFGKDLYTFAIRVSRTAFTNSGMSYVKELRVLPPATCDIVGTEESGTRAVRSSKQMFEVMSGKRHY